MYVERNGKQLPRDPWSFRQTGVVHKYSAMKGTSQVILLHPNSEALAQIKLKDHAESHHSAMAEHPLNMHLIIISLYLTNWQDHLEFLASELEHIVSALLQQENLVRLTPSSDDISTWSRLSGKIRSRLSIQSFSKRYVTSRTRLYAKQADALAVHRFSYGL
jgi:hypothetical protein